MIDYRYVLWCAIFFCGVQPVFGHSSPSSSVSVLRQKENPSIVKASHVASEFGKPPLVRLHVSMNIFNSGSHARWVIFPYSLSKGPYLSEIDILQEYQFPQGILGQFLGTGHFQAVKLPAQGKLTIKNITLPCFGDDCQKLEPLKFEVLFVDDFKIDGESIIHWFSKDPLLPKKAELDFQQGTLLPEKKLQKSAEKKGQISFGNRIEVWPVTLHIKK